ncbi:MAG: competence/damage-inducible protein A [Verrucomicrobiales bacterium]
MQATLPIHYPLQGPKPEPTVEVLNTGSELLLGAVTNTHAGFLGSELLKLGLRIERQTCVPDGPHIGEALQEALGRSGLIFVTGGLGPTSDDLTRDLTAQLLQKPLIDDAAIWQQIQERFGRRKMKAPESTRRQAQVPEGALVLPNVNGTAPGLFLPCSWMGAERWVFLLPGPPRELYPMFREQIYPFLEQHYGLTERPVMRIFRVIGVGESHVEQRVGAELDAWPDLEVGYCARYGEVDVRLIGPLSTVARGEQRLRDELGLAIYGENAEQLEDVVVSLLSLKKQTLAVAESCTGGLVANRITNVPGASAVFHQGMVTYSNESKIQNLGVDESLLSTHGAVSSQVAQAMARGILQRSKASMAISTTGIAGPSGGSEEKPVGTVFLAYASADGKVRVEHRIYPVDRLSFKHLVSQTALSILREELLELAS